MDKRDLHFFKYRLHGKIYLKFYRDLKKFRLETLINHYEEFYFLTKYKEYGLEFLKFLNAAIELKIVEIIDMKDLIEFKESCILKWVFMNLDDDGRNKNN